MKYVASSLLPCSSILHSTIFYFGTFSGLKRTGKSCRLRWLNYLKPDIKRGNLTPQEQLLILELHSKWGNRFVKIYVIIWFMRRQLYTELYKFKSSMVRSALKMNLAHRFVFLRHRLCGSVCDLYV